MVPISRILPNLLMTSCKSTYCVNLHIHTHIMRPNFELKNANKATIAHTLSLAFLQLYIIVVSRFFSKLIFGPSIELKIDPPPPEFSPKKLNWNLICEKNWDQNFFCQCQFPIFFLRPVNIFMVTFQFSWEYFLGTGQQKGKWLEGRVERPAPKEFWGSSWRHLNWSS